MASIPDPAPRTAGVLLSVVLAALVACGGGGPEGDGVVPRAGMQFGAVPDLTGREVMVVPVQTARGVPTGIQPDAELEFALRERGSRVRWLFPDTLRRFTARNPGIDIALDRLPVGIFLRAQVEQVGDPLYGHLRRLGAITGAPLVLIPVRLRYRSEPVRVEERVLEPAMELSAALVHVRSGRVLWFGIVDGAPGGAGDPATLASTADALARAVVR